MEMRTVSVVGGWRLKIIAEDGTEYYVGPIFHSTVAALHWQKVYVSRV